MEKTIELLPTDLTTLSGAELYALVGKVKSTSLDYDTKRAYAIVIANEMDKRGKLVAKRFNKRYVRINISALLR